MVKLITANFDGEDGSLGYGLGKEYKLRLKCLNSGRIRVEDLDRPNGTCTYANMVKFLDNWTNIKT